MRHCSAVCPGSHLVGLRRRRTDHSHSPGDPNGAPANQHCDPVAHFHRDPAAHEYARSRCDASNDDAATPHVATLSPSGTHRYVHSNADCCANANRHSRAHGHAKADTHGYPHAPATDSDTHACATPHGRPGH